MPHVRQIPPLTDPMNTTLGLVGCTTIEWIAPTIGFPWAPRPSIMKAFRVLTLEGPSGSQLVWPARLATISGAMWPVLVTKICPAVVTRFGANSTTNPSAGGGVVAGSELPSFFVKAFFRDSLAG